MAEAPGYFRTSTLVPEVFARGMGKLTTRKREEISSRFLVVNLPRPPESLSQAQFVL
jgi:hypothetical protein